MSRINTAIEKVMDLIDALGLYANITRGALGTGNTLCCEIGPSSPSEVYLNKHQYIPVDLTINGKNKDLETLSDDMNKIHESLTMMTEYPSGNGWNITDITTMTEPQIVAREDDGSWFMASALLIKIETLPESPAPDPLDPEPLPEDPDPDEDPEENEITPEGE